MSDVKIYEPNREIKLGILRSYKNMASDLVTASELGLRLFKRDFSARYRQSALGVLWVVLMPIFTVGVFVILNMSGILNVGSTKVPYVVYALFGLAVWNLFTGITTSVAGAITASGSMISKINFPRIALVYSPVLTSLIDFGIRVLLLTIVMIITKTAPAVLFIPITLVSLVPLVALALGLGLIFAIFGTVLKDLANVLSIVFSFLMFISPVVYPITGRPGLIKVIAKINPLTSLIDLPRNLLFYGSLTNGKTFMVVAMISLILFLLGWRFYTVAISRIVEKI